MADREDKKKKDIPDEQPAKQEDFDEDHLMELSGEESGVETAPDSPVDTAMESDYLHRGGGMTVDDVLSKKRPLEFDPPELEIKTSPEPGKPVQPVDQEPPPEKTDKKRPLEIRTMPYGEGKWPVKGSDPKALDALIRADKFEVKAVPGEKVRVDHTHLTKLDESLKDELKQIRKKADRILIPGEFLEARRRLTEDGVLECPVCKIGVPDTPGKVDHCPRCGLALDDYLGEYKAEWERKHKHTVSEGVKDLFPKKKKRERTPWELWKEDQGLDPEAEILACPTCSYERYDDPFVANRCPHCKIPLDLHLQFPREYIREREKHTRGKRAMMIKDKKPKK